MAHTDAQGRPEIVMHPDIVRGGAGHRVVAEPDGGPAPAGEPANAQTGHRPVEPEPPRRPGSSAAATTAEPQPQTLGQTVSDGG